MKLIAALAIFASAGSAAAAESHLRERKLSSSSSDVSLSSGVTTCADLNTHTVTFQTSWELDEDTAVSYPCSNGYLTNFAANPNLLEDLMDAVGPCFKYCNIDNGGYKFVVPATGSGDLSDIFDDDGKTCNAIDNDETGVKGPSSCTCNSPTDVSGCSTCSGTVKTNIVSCYDVAP